MAYRVAPFLGAYRNAPLLGDLPPRWTSIRTQPVQGVFRSTPITLAPAPSMPVSSPTVVVAPAPQPMPVFQPMAPSVFTETPNILPMAPTVPLAPGSSPAAPAPSGGGGGGGGGSNGGGGLLYPDGSVSASGAAVQAPSPQGGMPVWIVPVAAGVLLFMFSRRKAAHV
jgi:hypothetical protein